LHWADPGLNSWYWNWYRPIVFSMICVNIRHQYWQYCTYRQYQPQYRPILRG